MTNNRETVVMRPDESSPVQKPKQKRSRYTTLAIKHLTHERDKAIAIRDRAAADIAELDGALLALGWPEA